MYANEFINGKPLSKKKHNKCLVPTPASSNANDVVYNAENFWNSLLIMIT